MTTTSHHLPTAAEIEQAWRGVQSVLRARRLDPARRAGPRTALTGRFTPAKGGTCFLD